MRVSEFNITEQYLSEVPMNPAAYAGSLETAHDKGVKVGFEFEVCMPEETISAENAKPVDPSGIEKTWAENIQTLLGTEQWFNSVELDDLREYADIVKPVEYNGNTYSRDDGFETLVSAWLSDKLGKKIKKNFEALHESIRKKLIKIWTRQKIDFLPKQLNAWTFFKAAESELAWQERNRFRDGISEVIYSMPYRKGFWMDVFGTTDLVALSTDPRLEWDVDMMTRLFVEDDDNGYNNGYVAAAKVMQKRLQQLFGNTILFHDYHERNKDATSWYVEPDGSLEPNGDDEAVEVVTPPMPVKQGIEALKTFYQLAKELRLYTSAENHTGLHINVSIPDKLDVLKLAVFAGDEHVIREWGREDNSYVQSVIKDLRDSFNDLKQDYENDSYSKKQILNPSKKNDYKKLLQIAKDTSDEHMASVNFNGKYVSFRHAGGDYLNQQQGVLNVVGRFVRAMVIAADPTAYRKEYLAKLTSLIHSKEEKVKVTSASQILKLKNSPIQAVVVAIYGTNTKGTVSLMSRESSDFNDDGMNVVPMSVGKAMSDEMLEIATARGKVVTQTREYTDKFPNLRAISVGRSAYRVNENEFSVNAIWDAYGDRKIGIEIRMVTMLSPGDPMHTMIFQQILTQFKKTMLLKKGSR